MSNKRKVKKNKTVNRKKNRTAPKATQTPRISNRPRHTQLGDFAKQTDCQPVPFAAENFLHLTETYEYFKDEDHLFVTGVGNHFDSDGHTLAVFKVQVFLPASIESEEKLVEVISEQLADHSLFAGPELPECCGALLTDGLFGEILRRELRNSVEEVLGYSYVGSVD